MPVRHPWRAGPPSILIHRDRVRLGRPATSAVPHWPTPGTRRDTGEARGSSPEGATRRQQCGVEVWLPTSLADMNPVP